MAELLLELLSEEIPARMQRGAEEALARLLAKALEGAGLEHEAIETFSTPRRLVARVTGLPKAQPDVREERRGPRADAPAQAIEGFLKSAGVARADCELREEKKGLFLYAVIEKKGRATAEVLAGLLEKLIREFPWPKSMLWRDDGLRWVRPLRSILCIFDRKIVDGKLRPVRLLRGDVLENIEAWEEDARQSPKPIEFGNVTYGHRFMAPEAIPVRDYVDYVAKLQTARVILSASERQLRIRIGAEKLAKSSKLKLLDDAKLLEEVAGLVEWPVPLLGEFDKAYLDLPPEVLISEMRQHQKYFALADSKGKLANKFIVVANIEAKDKGKAIAAGNGRVLAARLSDARFFWDKDRKTSLEDNLTALDGIIFHEKLGSVGDKARRIEKLAGELAAYIPGCDKKHAMRAAKLAKCDLVTGMVGEFPDLQGVMGGYYASAEGAPVDIALAIREHYAPQGPADACPAAPVSIAVALADKIDTLVGFFAIDEKPTGSKDPFALRRAALGVIRLITENGLRIGLQKDAKFSDDLLAFFADRLKVQQREAGVRHDLIDAVFSLGGEDDLVRLLARVVALQEFLATDDGENLLAGYKRAVNIVRIEEKKDKTSFAGDVDEKILEEKAEKALYKKLTAARKRADAAIAKEDFAAAMTAIAALRAPIDKFFDDVTVNADDKKLRANRLRLLAQIRASLDAVADFSKIQGGDK
ncbi:MAG: glycine--tRNA ligase subunit beta [Proteobacteria bacterium]|nr:glycine--tRNA ligase subunit beta [Pseudomonadota bacterium]